MSDTAPRMTRSRAREQVATTAAPATSTPGPARNTRAKTGRTAKTTGARGGKAVLNAAAAAQQDVPVSPMHLFKDTPGSESPRHDDAGMDASPAPDQQPDSLLPAVLLDQAVPEQLPTPTMPDNMDELITPEEMALLDEEEEEEVVAMPPGDSATAPELQDDPAPAEAQQDDLEVVQQASGDVDTGAGDGGAVAAAAAATELDQAAMLNEVTAVEGVDDGMADVMGGEELMADVMDDAAAAAGEAGVEEVHAASGDVVTAHVIDAAAEEVDDTAAEEQSDALAAPPAADTATEHADMDADMDMEECVPAPSQPPASPEEATAAAAAPTSPAPAIAALTPVACGPGGDGGVYTPGAAAAEGDVAQDNGDHGSLDMAAALDDATVVMASPAPVCAAATAATAAATPLTATRAGLRSNMGASRLPAAPTPTTTATIATAATRTPGATSSRTPSARTTAAAARTVKFGTPLAASPPATHSTTKTATVSGSGGGGPRSGTTTATTTRKSALRPSSHFATPGATAKTVAAAATTTGGKRVSISTPVHPKSAGLARAVVRTPYPRSGGSGSSAMHHTASDSEADDTQPLQAGQEQDADKAITSPAAAAAEPVAAATEMPSALPFPPAAAAEEEEEEDVGAGCEAAAMQLDPEAGGPTAAAVEVVPPRTRPASASAKARDALQSLAEAEGRSARPATAAHPPSHTPGGRALPHYMAPTSSTALRKQQQAAAGGAAAGVGGAAGARVIGGPTQLKSKVVPSDTYDPTSLGSLRRAIKDTPAAHKAAAAAATKAQAAATSSTFAGAVRKSRLVDKARVADDRSHLARVDADDAAAAADDQRQRDTGHNPAAEATLLAAMDKLNLGKPARPASTAAIAPLRGVPLPEGKHTRFTAKGKPRDSPSNERPKLRGVAPASGKHIRFGDE